MNRKEHLLTIMSEECLEIAKEISKGLRFGLEDHHPTQTGTNAQKINHEFNDLVAVMEMLRDDGHLSVDIDRELVETKKERVEKYLLYSQDKGTLNK